MEQETLHALFCNILILETDQRHVHDGSVYSGLISLCIRVFNLPLKDFAWVLCPKPRDVFMPVIMRWHFAFLLILFAPGQGVCMSDKPTFESRIGPMIHTYCLECHSSHKKKGDLDLEAMLTPGMFSRYFKEWENVVEQLHAGDMPPPKAIQPPHTMRQFLADAVDLAVAESSSHDAGDPGDVLLRRMTQAEYLYSIKDLTGLDLAVRSLLPEDIVGAEGFANTGEVQFMQSATLERYLEIARKVASHALVGSGNLHFYRHPGQTGQEWSAIERIQDIYRRYGFRTGAGEGAEPFGLEIFPKAFLALWKHQHRGHFGTPGQSLEEIAKGADLPPLLLQHLQFQLSRADAQPPLQDIIDRWNDLPPPEGFDAAVEISGRLSGVESLFTHIQSWQKQLAEKVSNAEESRLLDVQAALNSKDDAAIEFAGVFPSSSQREPAPSDRDPIPAPFDNTYNNVERNAFHYEIKYHREDTYLSKYLIDARTRKRLDEAWDDLYDSFAYHQAMVNLLWKHFHGPEPQSMDIHTLTPEKLALLPHALKNWVKTMQHAQNKLDVVMERQETQHLQQCLAFAERAWRRPLREHQSQQLKHYYARLRHSMNLSHEEAIRTLICRVLTSPYFLYRPESSRGGQIIKPLDNWELASRLSYFLWASPPDKDLKIAARQGLLDDLQELSLQTQRMLSDPRIERFAEEFFGQWFGFYRFSEYQGVDETHFTHWTPSLRSSLHREALLFFNQLLQKDRHVNMILLSEDGFLNQELGGHYKIPLPDKNGGFQKVSHLSRYQRGGLLGLGFVHAVTSAPLRTSIVKRGDWILRRVLGTPVPPPPADAGSIAVEGDRGNKKTMRELLEAHQRDQKCVQCHQRMDPLGFAMESFGVTGQLRTHYESGLPVEDGGTLPDGTPLQGFAGIRTYLKDQMPLFYRTFCTKLLGYGLGRREQLSDRKLIDSMMDSIGSGEPISQQILLLVTSRQFRHKRVVSQVAGNGVRSLTEWPKKRIATVP